MSITKDTSALRAAQAASAEAAGTRTSMGMVGTSVTDVPSWATDPAHLAPLSSHAAAAFAAS